jgi:hypothetical protein
MVSLVAYPNGLICLSSGSSPTSIFEAKHIVTPGTGLGMRIAFADDLLTQAYSCRDSHACEKGKHLNGKYFAKTRMAVYSIALHRAKLVRQLSAC